MTIEQTAAVLQVIDSVYSPPQLDKDTAVRRLQVWSALLKEYDDELVRKALAECLAVCKFVPKPADIIEQVRKIQSKACLSDDALWLLAMQCARKIESVQYYTTFGGYIGPAGKKTASELKAEARALFDSLPPAVREWAGDVYTLAGYASVPDNSLLQFERPRFNAAMQSARRAGEFERITPVGLLAGANGSSTVQLPSGL